MSRPFTLKRVFTKSTSVHFPSADAVILSAATIQLPRRDASSLFRNLRPPTALQQDSGHVAIRHDDTPIAAEARRAGQAKDAAQQGCPRNAHALVHRLIAAPVTCVEASLLGRY